MWVIEPSLFLFIYFLVDKKAFQVVCVVAEWEEQKTMGCHRWADHGCQKVGLSLSGWSTCPPPPSYTEPIVSSRFHLVFYSVLTAGIFFVSVPVYLMDTYRASRPPITSAVHSPTKTRKLLKVLHSVEMPLGNLSVSKGWSRPFFLLVARSILNHQTQLCLMIKDGTLFGF